MFCKTRLLTCTSLIFLSDHILKAPAATTNPRGHQAISRRLRAAVEEEKAKKQAAKDAKKLEKAAATLAKVKAAAKTKKVNLNFMEANDTLQIFSPHIVRPPTYFFGFAMMLDRITLVCDF